MRIPVRLQPVRVRRENDIQREVLEALRKMGKFCLRLNSGKVRIGSRFIQLCPSGTPDMLVIEPQRLSDRHSTELWAVIQEFLDCEVYCGCGGGTVEVDASNERHSERCVLVRAERVGKTLGNASLSRVTWIEMKSEKGPTRESQEEFKRAADNRGETYVLARSLDDVLKILK